MPITFSSAVLEIKHVQVRSRKWREANLPPLPTAEEAATWVNRELKAPKRLREPNYDDGVGARREAEKAVLDAQARLKLALAPSTVLEDLAALKVRPERIVPSNQRILAEVAQVEPQLLVWSHAMSQQPAAKLLDMAARCRNTADPAFAWKLNVQLNEPRYGKTVSYQVPASFLPEGSRNPGANGTMGLAPKPSRNAEITAWMKAAEENRLPNRTTKCAVTGKTLVNKQEGWRLAPAFGGMAKETAERVISAAAIQAGLVQGMVRGEAPPAVESLRHNAQQWLGLVIATRHPVFYQTALLMKLREIPLASKLEDNKAEWERVTKIARTNVSDSR